MSFSSLLVMNEFFSISHEWLFSFWSKMIVNEAIKVHECICALRLGMVKNCHE